MEHFNFNTRFRKQGKSIATYVWELRSIAKNCNYEITLETMLRDRIVCGVNDRIIQCRLLAEKELTFKKSMEIVQGTESAATNVRKLTDTKHTTQGSTTVTEREPIHQIGTKGKSCYRCGSPTHFATTCKFKETVCHNCGKIGYLEAYK